MTFFHVVVVGLVCAAIGLVGWFVTPRGKSQTVKVLLVLGKAYDSLIRTSTLLALSCCYIMWAVTYLAQLHPLIRTSTAERGRFDDIGNHHESLLLIYRTKEGRSAA